jgi:predicted transcriptional regulator
MKGTFCGIAVALAMAVAPAIAQADVSVGSVTSTVPSTSTVPAAPSVAASAPAPVTPAPIVVDPVAGSVSLSTPAVSAYVSGDKVRAGSGPAVVSTVTKANRTVKKIVNKAVSSTSITKNAVATVKKTHAAAAKKTKFKIVVEQTTPSGRVLAWSSDDPHSGCNAGGWQVCIPLTEFGPTQNQCNGGEMVTLQGSGAIWMKFIANPSNGTMTTMQRTFFRGITSTAPGTFGNNYFGTDQQNDRHKTFGLLAYSDDNREHEKLIVTSQTIPDPTTDVSMFLYVHTVVSFDPTSGFTIKIAKTQIICKPGDKPANDPDQGDHKETSSDHNKQAYHGYNDDPITSWNEQE